MTTADPFSRFIGSTFSHVFQPYDDVTFRVDAVEPVQAAADSPSYVKARAAAGMVTLRGQIITGTRTSRLFQHSSTRPLTGSYSVCVEPRELEAGRRVDIAC